MKLTLAVAAILMITGCKSTPPEDKNSVYAFTDMILIDGSGTHPIEKATLVVSEGKILSAGPAETIAIPPEARVISLSGKTIIPGLISAHNHIGSVDGMRVSTKNYTRENVLKQLRQYQQYGVTTINSLGVNTPLFYELRKDLHEGRVEGADIFGADKGLGPHNGAPPLPKDFDGTAVARVSTPEEARQYVREMKSRDTDFIKIWLDDFIGTIPKMKPAVYRAAIEEARKLDVPVAVHVYYLEDARLVAQAGAHILAHGIREGKVDQKLIRQMKDKNVMYIPTLGVDESFYVYGEHPEWMKDRFFVKGLSPDLKEQIASASKMKELISNPTTDLRRKALKTNQENLKRLFDGGILIGMGTDSGANPWRIPGFAEHRELELMVQAGLTPLQALQIGTANAAKVMGLEDRGVLLPGMRADFLILEKDPRSNILNTRTIEQVWNRGRRVALNP